MRDNLKNNVHIFSSLILAAHGNHDKPHTYYIFNDSTLELKDIHEEGLNNITGTIAYTQEEIKKINRTIYDDIIQRIVNIEQYQQQQHINKHKCKCKCLL